MQLLETQTGYMLIKLGQSAAVLFDDVVAHLQLRGRHIRVLESIHTQALSQQELCARVGMDRTTMVAVIDELESLGFARRERSQDDRRKHVVLLTPAGADVFAEVTRILREAQDDFLAPLSPEERDQLRSLVSRLFAPQPASCESPASTGS